MVRIGNESCLCMHRKWIIQLFERAPITESVFHFETFIGVDLFSPVVPRLRAVNRQQNLFRGRKYAVVDGQLLMTMIRSDKFNNWINFSFSILWKIIHRFSFIKWLSWIQVDLECNANHLYASLGSKRLFQALSWSWIPFNFLEG